MTGALLAGGAAAAAAAAGYGWFEAGWLRTRVREVALERLPRELDGVRIAHLSDFHLGVPSRGAVAAERAVEWVAERRPDLVCITGDLLSRRRGERRLRGLLERLGTSYVVLGNHDFAQSRDPFSQPVDLHELPRAHLLSNSSDVLELRGRRVQVAGVDPRSYSAGRARAERLADEEADLRILLCHFPGVARTLPAGAFDLVLAGHMHAGQIVLPYPGGRLLLAHPRAREAAGVYRYGSTTLHVSPGVGTTFVPFRFCARPEATELVLRPA
ncbi:MAG TPA: metallophosphoesterase [Gaiellaceae bacterium]|nr:metallophosphoesterase [Gaiellaceae bacterium]